ncbi:MAG: phage shock protein PspA [Alphaproteobacteria bacterium]|nr:MAG: phage shock protein PspA [Alphaproteobacteria bacterium]
MGIFSRLADIINSNLNALLDHAEDPEKMVRLIIQEMEDTLVEVRAAAAKTIADQKDVERRLRRLREAEAEWQRKAELALSKDREDLARGALMEKAKVAAMTEELEADLEHLKEALERHEEDVVKLEAKLREAKVKKKTLEARHKTVTNQLRMRRTLHDSRIDDAFSRFDAVEMRLDRLEGEVESYDLGEGKGRTLDDEFAALEVDETIEAELEALKAKLKPAKKAEN